MKRLLILGLLLLASSNLSADTWKFTVTNRDFTEPPLPVFKFVLVDTEAELPGSGISEGDLAYSKDSDKLWKRSASAWVEVGGSGGSGLTHVEVMRRVSFGGF